ncbi:MAG TPA: HAMP domain-containing sensor histidine kinase [Pseudonocardiaceae bacterium]|jgi:signal transduction histidine kinase|nr:HAMP domain-containing sensor histidine kinase [Pseudonocardiaceae bacterium]
MNRIFVRAIVLAATAGIVVILAVFGLIEWHAVSGDVEQVAGQQADLAASVVSATTDMSVVRVALARAQEGAGNDLAVRLADGRILGLTHATTEEVGVARGRELLWSSVSGGRVLFRSVLAPGGSTATVEVFVPTSAVLLPLVERLGLLAAGGLVAIGVAVGVGYWYSRPLVRTVRAITSAAATIGQGRTGIEVPASPASEVNQLVDALNQISRRVEQLIAGEREFVADLSHRLRTPLTALRLDSESIGDDPKAQRIRLAVLALGNDVDNLIRTAQRVAEPDPPICDVAKVLADRMAFWSVLADHQARSCEFRCISEQAAVDLPADDVGAVVDALLGNVFQHTPAGTAFAATVVCYAGWVSLLIEDGGPGIADTRAALRRGASGYGSTGLGLDIARHAVEATGGTIYIDQSQLGGARIRLRFAQAGSHHAAAAPKAWRLWSRSADLPAKPD